MRSVIVALAFSGMLTIEQGDPRRTHLDPPSAAVSADGRFIAFTTFARLAPADRDEYRDVYVLDRAEQRVTLESAPLDGVPTHSSHPALDSGGRFIMYEAGDQIVLRDRHDGSTRVLGAGRQPAISADGTVVAFTSDQASDICVVDVAGGRWSMVHSPWSVACIGREARAGVSPTLSRDGRYVAFSALGSVFIYDRQFDAMRRVAAGWDPAISAEGDWITFVSAANRMYTVILADVRTGTSQIVSRSRTGRRANGHSANPAISRDGRFVAFQSEASNMVDDEDYNLLWDVFIFDRDAGVTSRISGDPGAGWMAPSGGPALSAGGDVVAFSSRHPTDEADMDNDYDLFVAPVTVAATAAARERRGPDAGPAVSQARIRDAR